MGQNTSHIIYEYSVWQSHLHKSPKIRQYYEHFFLPQWKQTSQNHLYLYKMWVLTAFIPLVPAFKEFWPNNVGRIHSLSYTSHEITNFRAFVRVFFLLFLNKGGTLVDVFWHNCKQIHLSVTFSLFSYLYNFKISLLICTICFNDALTRHARELSVNLIYKSRSFIATLSAVRG